MRRTISRHAGRYPARSGSHQRGRSSLCEASSRSRRSCGAYYRHRDSTNHAAGPDEDLDAAFAAMTKGQADAVVIQGSLSTERIANLARERRLPAASTTRAFADAGGFMSDGPELPPLFWAGAQIAARNFYGPKPRQFTL